MATFNATSARDAEATRVGGPKTCGEVLRHQFRGMGGHLLGIQEARDEEDNRNSAGYYILSSGSTDDGKNLGVELWAATAMPYAVSKWSRVVP